MFGLKIDFSKWGPITVIIVALVLLATAGGLVVVIVQPHTLTFNQYLGDLKTMLIALGILSSGHAGLAAAQRVADAKVTASLVANDGDLPGKTQGVKGENFVPEGAPDEATAVTPVPGTTASEGRV